jgi:diaminopimelate decarboxylase
MADNPGALQARYSCLTVAGYVAKTAEVSIGGPVAIGDVLIEPVDAERRRLIAVPVAGMSLSMSSNYNGARRPAVLWLEDGQAKLIQRRETVEDLSRRDVGL